MEKGKASWTAEIMAIHRSVESLRPANSRLFYDPYAMKFLSAKYRIVGKSRLLTGIVYWFFAERPFPGGSGEAIARTRYIDDYMLECIAAGIKQLVILGAGYDSRAYRFDELKKDIKVFEVDHPDTQTLKIEKVKRILGTLPDHVVYVSIDFSRETLDQKLSESGYERNLKTLFIWEGVTMYLTAEEVDETLAFVAENSYEGSSIIFNYVLKSVVDGSDKSKLAKKWKERFARIGEPITFGLAEADLENYLLRRGFWQVRNVNNKFLKGYFTEVNRKHEVWPLLCIAHATVKPRGQV